MTPSPEQIELRSDFYADNTREALAREGITSPEDIFESKSDFFAISADLEFFTAEPEALAGMLSKLMEDRKDLERKLNWEYFKGFNQVWAGHGGLHNAPLLELIGRFAVATDQTHIHSPAEIDDNKGKVAVEWMGIKRELALPEDAPRDREGEVKPFYLSIIANCNEAALDSATHRMNNQLDVALMAGGIHGIETSSQSLFIRDLK